MRLIILRIIMFAGITSANAETAYTGFNWVDPLNQRTQANTTLIEQRGRITYIGPPKDLNHSTTVVDLTGKYVVAGFIDTHAHVTLGAVSMQKNRGKLALVANHSDAIAQHNGRVMLAYGITDIRNPGGASARTVGYKTKVTNGEWLGPDAYTSGELLDKHPFEGLSTAVGSAKAIQHEIARQKALGVDFIKLYTGLGKDLLAAAIKSAHQHNLPAVAHLDAIPWDVAAELGLDGIVHAMPTSIDLLNEPARQNYLDTRRVGAFSFFEWYEAVEFSTPRFQQMLTTLADHQTTLDLTLIAFRNAFWGDQATVTEHSELQLAHPELVENWRSFFTFTIGWQPQDFTRAKAVWPKVEQFTRLLHQSGVHLSIGTDMGNPWVIPGVSFHQEMQLLAEAGIPAYDILTMATLNGAESIRQADHKGSLAIGKLANFVILDKDPIADINNTQTIYSVVKGGSLYQPQKLLTAIQAP